MADNTKQHKVRSFADEALVNDLVDGIHRFSEKRYPFLVGTIVWIFDFISKSLAFNVRAITRLGMGSRTFGFFLILDAVFLQKVILFFIIYAPLGFEFKWLWQIFDSDSSIGAAFSDFLFWTPSIDLIKAQFKETESFREILQYIFAELLPYVYGYLVLFAGLAKIDARSRDRIKRVKQHSYGSGYSLFSLFFENSKTMTSDRVNLYIEPLAVFLIGLGMSKFLGSSVGLFFMICAIAVFYEEYKPYARRRSKIQDKIDAEFEVEKLKEGLKAYDNAQKKKQAVGTSSNTPVALAGNYDAEKYRQEMKKSSGEGAAVSLG